MKTIKGYASFINENKVNEFVDIELDQDVIDYYLEIIEKGVPREEAIQQVAADFGIANSAISIIVDEAGIKESWNTGEKEEEEEDINESSDEDEYLTPKQKNLPEGLKKGIIKKMKKDGKKVGDKKDDKKKDDKKEDKKDDSKKDDSNKSDEDKYLSVKQKKLPEGLKKAIIKKAKAKK